MIRRYQECDGGSKHERMKRPRLDRNERRVTTRPGPSKPFTGDSQRPDASASRATSSNVSGSRPVTLRTVVDTTSISPRAIDV